MIGIPLFRISELLPTVKFDYEIRTISSIEFNNYYYIAIGDKSGLLKILVYDGNRIKKIYSWNFEYKIFYIDFLITEEDVKTIGLLITLDKDQEPNVYVCPSVDSKVKNLEMEWRKVFHNHGKPRLFAQPYSESFSKIIASFQNGDFMIGKLASYNEHDYVYEPQIEKHFHSQIISVCTDFSKNLKRNRKRNHRKDNNIYIASQAGEVSKIVLNYYMELNELLAINRIKQIGNSISRVISINDAIDIHKNLRGVFGIAGTDFFCLFSEDKKRSNINNYRMITDKSKNTLHSICIGIFKIPGSNNSSTNIILTGDTQGFLRVRQFSGMVHKGNLYEVIFEKRKMFSMKMSDRIFGMTSLNPKYAKSQLLQIAIGLGNHEVIFMDLLDKDFVLREIEVKYFRQKVENQSLLCSADVLSEIVTLSRKSELDIQSKYELIALIFNQRYSEESLAFQLLINGEVDKLIEIIYWLLSCGSQQLFEHIYKIVCNIIQSYSDNSPQTELNKKPFEKLNVLLKDIQKYWIEGRTFSQKHGNIEKLVLINSKNEKIFDRLIYQSRIDDNKYDVISSNRISKNEIQSICNIRGIYFISDNQGELFFLNEELTKRCSTININSYLPIMNKVKSDLDILQTNFIRQISVLPDTKRAVLLLRSGGLLVFQIPSIRNYPIPKQNDKEGNRFLQNLFTCDGCEYFFDGIFPYVVKSNNEGIYVGTRFGKLLKLQFESNNLIKKVVYEFDNEIDRYNPIWDFAFLADDKIVLSDYWGNLVIVNTISNKCIKFSLSSSVSAIFAWDNNSFIIGLENGHVIKYDIIGQSIHCQWSYDLTGAVRFIGKTYDNNIIIGGLVAKALIIHISGKLVAVVNFNRYNDNSFWANFNRILPLPQEKGSSSNILCFLVGDQNGFIKKVRIFPEKVFENIIKSYFDQSTNNVKIFLRCINISENTLRRLYAEHSNTMKDFDGVCSEIEALINSKNYNFHIGLLESLIPLLFLKLKEVTEYVSDNTAFKDSVTRFENILIPLINRWGIVRNINCQMLMKVIGVELFKILYSAAEHLKINNVIIQSDMSNLKTIRQLVDDIHLRCASNTLSEIYEILRQYVCTKKSTVDVDYITEFILGKIEGYTFDNVTPDPLMQRQVSVLADMVNYSSLCPIKLGYKIIFKRIDITILDYLSTLMKDDNREILSTLYSFCFKLENLENVLDVVDKMCQWPSVFIEKFEQHSDSFYYELKHILFQLNIVLTALSPGKMIENDNAYYIDNFPKDFHYFSREFKWFTSLSKKVTALKNIIRAFQSSDEPVPVAEIIKLRLFFEKKKRLPFDLNKPFFVVDRLNSVLIRNVDEILSKFCEVTLPITALQKTTRVLENYMNSNIHTDVELFSYDNPQANSVFNKLFRDLFDVLIVGMLPHYACFCYTELNDSGRKYISVNFSIRRKEHFLFIEKSDILQNEADDENLTIKYYLYLPDISDIHGYYLISNKKFINKQNLTSISRSFESIIRIINFYIIAFNKMINTEITSRLSHRLFAHQTKEPILALLQMLSLLTDENFHDNKRVAVMEYHEKMLSLVQSILSRAEIILTANKLSMPNEIKFEEFNLTALLSEVAQIMRKVMKTLCYKGSITYKSDQSHDFNVYSDKNKIKQILEQLIRNSMKYCNGIRAIELNAGRDKNFIYFMVTDNGIGIDANELPLIFTKFYRGEYALTNNIDGDGLGLWISKTWAVQLGGDLDAGTNRDVNQKAEGAKFTLRIRRITIPKNEAN